MTRWVMTLVPSMVFGFGFWNLGFLVYSLGNLVALIFGGVSSGLLVCLGSKYRQTGRMITWR